MAADEAVAVGLDGWSAAHAGRRLAGVAARIAPLIAVVLVFSMLKPETFAQASNVQLILSQTAVAALLACGVSMSLTAGVFDLSFGALVSVIGVLVAKFLNDGFGWPLAVLVALLLAAVVGAVTGVVIVRTQVPSIVVTLGMQSVLFGIVTWLSDGNYISVTDKSFTGFGRGHALLGIPNEALLMIVVCGAGALAMRYLVSGRNLQAVGANAEACRLAGIPVNLYLVSALVATAVFSGIAACLVTSQLSAGNPGVGPGYLLPAFAAAFIGASVSRSGAYTFVGAVYGAVLLTTLNSGLVIINAPSWIQSVVTGVVLIFAVAASRIVRRRALAR